MKTTHNTILITGGSSGIGLGFAKEFLRLGNKIIICGRSKERLNKVKQEHPEIITKVCNVSIAKEREKLYEWIKANYSDVNILMNNAGIQLGTDITRSFNSKNIGLEMDTNIIAPVHLSSLFVNLLETKKESAIINITSGLAFAPLAFIPVYCATKAALHSLTLSLRHNLKNTSIKVFEIAPPSVDTQLGNERRENKSQSHGAISVAEFLKDAMEAIAGDVYEAAIGQAKELRSQREELFNMMNK